jgi:hypothetical protein
MEVRILDKVDGLAYYSSAIGGEEGEASVTP